MPRTSNATIASYFLKVSSLERWFEKMQQKELISASVCHSAQRPTYQQKHWHCRWKGKSQKPLFLAPIFNNSTDHGGARRTSNCWVFLKQWQCRNQKEDSSAYSQSSFHRMDLWIWQVFLFVNQTNFIRKQMKWGKCGNASCHFCITF